MASPSVIAVGLGRKKCGPRLLAPRIVSEDWSPHAIQTTSNEVTPTETNRLDLLASWRAKEKEPRHDDRYFALSACCYNVLFRPGTKQQS